MLSMSRRNDLIVFYGEEIRSYRIDFQSIGQMLCTFISNFIVSTIHRDQRLFFNEEEMKKKENLPRETISFWPNSCAELSLPVHLFYSIEEEELSMSIE